MAIGCTAAVIAQAVWLYFRFPQSLRMVGAMLAQRGIVVRHETIRRCALVAVGDKWRLDDVVIAINGAKRWLWRAVDQDGVALDVLVQRRRDVRAAARPMRRLLRRRGHSPRVMIIDNLRSAAAGRVAEVVGSGGRRNLRVT